MTRKVEIQTMKGKGRVFQRRGDAASDEKSWDATEVEDGSEIKRWTSRQKDEAVTPRSDEKNLASGDKKDKVQKRREVKQGDKEGWQKKNGKEDERSKFIKWWG